MRADRLFAEGVKRLVLAGVPEPDADAWYLFFEATGFDRVFYCTHTDEEIHPSEEERFFAMVAKRACRIPVHRILGEREFIGFPMYVTEDTLVPRLETECLVEEALDVIRPGDRVLDLCTGTGCIPIALQLLAKERFQDAAFTFAAVDLNEGALRTAARNCERNHAVIDLYRGDLYEALPGDTEPFDMITANPPYIPGAVLETLEPEVRIHDPRMALDGGPDGLLFYRRLAEQTLSYLKEGGALIMEIGDEQGKDVVQLLGRAGFIQITLKQDLTGRDRVVLAKKPGPKKEES